MSDNKYLAQGRNEFYYYVKDGYSISLSDDGTTFTCMKTDMQDGYYDQSGPLDKEVESVYRNRLSRPVMFLEASMTIEHYVHDILSQISKIIVVPITDTPKFTKAIADGLDKMGETMAFREKTAFKKTTIEYIAICPREKLDAIFSKSCYVSPARWYNATQWKGDRFGKIGNFVMLITDVNQNYVSIIANIDFAKRLKTLEKAESDE